MAEVKLKEEQELELWEPAEVENRRIKEDPDCGDVQSPGEAALSPVQIKEEPKEIQTKEESIQVFPVIVSVRSEKEESLLHETVKEENREDRDGPEAENSSDTDDSADWTPSAESPTPQTQTEQLQEPAHGNDVSGDGGPDKPHKCSQCGRGLSTRSELRRHVRIHTGEKPFSCSVCGQSFSLNVNLKTHMRTHTGEKPFRCAVCAMCFSQNGSLRRHMRSHTRERPFRCSLCEKSFSRKGHLQVHALIHTGERPFRCSVCGKNFSLKIKLNHT
uniref:C2H2-type domain-containing protein n=1 Tax=Neogobius melanostomus TaxID=47308 RepID=A0A8C6WF53_9GOBI